MQEQNKKIKKTEVVKKIEKVIEKTIFIRNKRIQYDISR